MNIQEVAKRAGVSNATASRALNRVPSVHPRLAKKVWRAASELGYYPNSLARGLVSGKTRILGLIVSDLECEPVSQDSTEHVLSTDLVLRSSTALAMKRHIRSS